MNTETDVAALTPVIQYLNQAGAIVIVHDTAAAPADPDLSGHHFNVTCGGCLSECRVMQPHTSLRDAREWASKHAGECRALPRFISAGEVERTTYSEFAAQYAKRAVRLLEGRSAAEDRISKLPLEARQPLEVAGMYAAVADVYARLARD